MPIKSFEQMFEEFVYECEYVRKVSRETIRGYDQAFRLLIKLLPTLSLDSLSTNTLIHFFSILQDRKRVVGKGTIKVGVKKSTVATYWSKLHVFFTWLVTKGHLHSNPFLGIKHPSPTYEDKKFLKKEDIEKIIAAIHLHTNDPTILKRNLCILYLFLFCGLRRGELSMLQIRDIDFERKMLTVRADTSKSATSRVIPLHSVVVMQLKEYLQARKSSTTPYLIASSTTDQKLTLDGLKHLVHKLSIQSKVRFHPHQLRHTFAVNFLKSSNNIAKLKQLLGHKSISMTLVYLRCLPADEMKGDIESMSIDRMI